VWNEVGFRVLIFGDFADSFDCVECDSFGCLIAEWVIVEVCEGWFYAFSDEEPCCNGRIDSSGY